MMEKIDQCIRAKHSEDVTLKHLSEQLGYSEYHLSRKFREISGMSFREYLLARKLAFTLKELRDTDRGILDIAVDTAFLPTRRSPGHSGRPTALPPALIAVTRGRTATPSAGYWTVSPASWTIWAETNMTAEADSLNEPTGWGIPLAECYGARLPLEGPVEVPPQMMLMEIPEGEYLIFEHGPFDFETENQSVERKIETTMKHFDYAASGYELDPISGRIFYFYHDCTRFWKYIRPVRKRA